ncbi:response regulator [Paraglaciecola sp. 25GB23A]|uniref:hybrid sensor histidine kinase/response regulator transcription factor n=1 Tax=Paraglaciecola sp. 25GB23A TaxID=3156068 RepID=UPI0032AF5810
MSPINFKLAIRIFLSSILLLLAAQSWAQSQQFYLPNHPELDNLNVRDVYLDDYSRMWIGTEDGVFRFDGNKVDAIDQTFAGDDGVIVPSGPISRFHRLNEQYLIVSYAPAGLALFDLYQDKYLSEPFSIVNYQTGEYPRGIYQLNQNQWAMVYTFVVSIIDMASKQEVAHFNIEDGYVADTTVSETQVHIVTTTLGLINYDIELRKFTTTALSVDYPAGSTISILNLDKHVYIAINNDLYTLQANKKLAFIERVPSCANDKGGFPYIRKFSVNQQTNIMVSNCGIFSLVNPTDTTDFRISTLVSFTPLQQAAHKTSSNYGNSIFIKADDTLFYLNKDGKIISQRENTKNVAGGFYSQNQYPDKHFAWVSNDDSQFTLRSDVISQFSGLTKVQLQRLLGTNKLRQSLFENEHTLWIGTQGLGLFKLVFNKQSNEWQTVWNGLAGWQVRALYQDGNILWIGTERNGIYWLDLTELTLHSLDLPENVDSAFHFVALNEQELLINTYAWGLLVINRQNKTITKHVPYAITSANTSETDFRMHSLRGIFKAKSGELWLATHQQNRNVIVLNPDFSLKQVYNQKNGLRHFMFDIMLDKNDTVWLATWGGGIAYKNKSEDQFHFLSRKDGLPSDTIYSLKIGVDGNLWASTLNGLVKIENYLDSDPKQWRITNYYKTDGLSTQRFDSESHYQQAVGTLVYGGYDGLLWFNPATDIRRNDLPPNDSFFTGLSVNGQNIALSANENNDKTHVTSSRVSLPYDAENIKLNFAAPSYILPAKNRYQYRTKQQNKIGNWIELQQPELSFASLVPGEYQFEVRGSNNDSVWAKSANLTLAVESPWWQSKPAYIAYVLLVILTGIIYAAWRNRAINRRNVQLENLIAQRTEELNKTLLTKQSMFENISHEFRTPLTLILGKAENLQKSDMDIEQKSHVSMIYKQAHRLYELVENLLKLAEMRAVEKQKRVCKPAIELYELLQNWCHLADEKQIKIHFESFIPDELQVVLIEETLLLVAGNIIGNAIKYSPTGTRIDIALSQQHGNIVLIFSDEGPGFKNIDNVFERFSRESNVGSGNGLGLAIVKHIVEQNKGSITLENIKPRGAKVSVSLPLNKLSNDIQAPVSINEDELTIDSTHQYLPLPQFPTKSQILLVEDNDDLRQYLISLLQPHTNVHSCTHGQEALLWLEQHSPDLILSDVMMPEMDGYELCAKVKQNNELKHIPFILLTAKSDLASQKKGLALQADDYIAKPFSSDVLLAKIANTLQTLQAFRHKLRESIVGAEVESKVLADSPNHELLATIQAQLQQNYADSVYAVHDLASALHMSEKTLNRRLNSLLRCSFSKLLRDFRLERAFEKLKQGHAPSTVCFDCGFSSQAYFGKCFKEKYKRPPGQI